MVPTSRQSVTPIQSFRPRRKIASIIEVRRPRHRASLALTGLFLGTLVALGHAVSAQTPVAIPSAASLLAGGANSGGTGVSGKVVPTSGAACFTGSLNTATDAFGDGCPGPYATFNTDDIRGGISADGLGNIFVIENAEQLIRRIDAKSGVITALNSGGTGTCTTALDGYGDGCPIVNFKLNGSRGGYTDPYGNLILGGYSAQMVNVVCNAVSPLCPNTANHKQVGYVYRVAGCTNSASGAGVASVGSAPGGAGDGLVASPNGNLSGDVSDWGSGSAVYATTCGNSNGGVDQPRGAIADKYGNVYIADTANLRYRVVVGPATFTLPNGTVLTNPLPAILQLDSVYHSVTAASMYGHIYPIFGAFTAATNGSITIPTAKGTACAGTYASGGSTLDTVGDGCPFYESTGGTSTSSTLGVGIDSEGNPIFLDQNNKAVRVLYIAGPKMAAAIQAANASSSLTIRAGYVYPLIGLPGSATLAGISYTPTLGTSTAINSNGSRMAVDPSGNLYFGDYGKNSIYMFDIYTGYTRNVLVSGANCATAAPNNDSVGDGCSAAIFGSTVPTGAPFSFGAVNAGSGVAMSITFDPHGNLILADQTDNLIRKVAATDLVPAQVGTALTQTLNIHNPAATTSMTAALLSPSPDISLGTVTCESTANADNTLDCSVPVTFTPLTAGRRSVLLSVTPSVGSTAGTPATFTLTGVASGSALTADIAMPVTATTGTVTSASGLAVDGAGNLATIDSGNFTGISASGTTAAEGTGPTSAKQVTIDDKDNIFAVNGSSSIYEFTHGSVNSFTPALPAATYATTPATLTATPAINGIAADALGNIFFSDQSNQAVFEIPAGTGFETLNQVVPIMTGFTTVGDIAVDGKGNLFVADTGTGKVYRILAGTAVYPTPTIAAATIVASSVAPTHITADTAGNLYIQDATAKSVTEYPVSGATSTVFTTTNAPTGIAVDSNGILYEAEAALTSINVIKRNAAAFTLPAANATLAATFSNTGNLAATGYAQTDSAEFPFTTGTSNGCGTIPSTSNGLAVGTSCTVTARFSPGNNGQLVTSKTTLLAAASTTGALTLSGQEPAGTTYTTTTSVTGATSAPYAPSATEITFSATESSTNSNSQNGESLNIAVANSSSTVISTTCTLSAGGCSIPLSGLTAGSYSITVTYPGDGTYLTSNASANFAITQVTPSLAWTPSSAALQYSAPLGTAYLNATATSNSATVPGVFVYKANGAEVNASSYLAIGSYPLTTTFYPTDAVDYTQNTASAASSLSVTQATTTAPIGATQTLVASDGTGNFTGIQAAVNAVGVTGGAIYIKPGTYTGDVSVVQPNVSLRGLGGDPTQVVITHAGGAFGGTGVYAYAGEFTSAQNNGSQSPGITFSSNADDLNSATLAVARGTNTAFSTTATTPNNFYAEYLTVQNTYDTDNSTMTTTYLPSANGGTCTANEGSPQTYAALYNSQLLCASQALAIWLVGDTAVMNNVYATSQQDTVYASAISAGNSPSRQFWFRGKISGDVDYLFGDAAAVFDHTSIYTTWHGSTATGTETIEAQNKSTQTGSASDYLSGYVMNSDVFTSQSSGMTNLYLGRPYGTFSTWIMLNSYVDQINALGYTTGLGPALVDATYGEYNDQAYTTPAGGQPDANGVLYLCQTAVPGYTGGTPPCGGSSGGGVLPLSARETGSINPGYGAFTAAPPSNVGMTSAQAQQFYPLAFLGKTITPGTYNTVATWNPLTAIATNANTFVPSSSPSAVNLGQSITLLMRPQTPGLGAVTNGVYTLPTGTYTVFDNGSQIATGNLDASGEATFTTSALTRGAHSFTWTYSGDSNFAGSSTSTAYALTVNGTSTTTSLSATTNPIVYGQSASITVTVSAATGTPTGNVTLTLDSASTQTSALSSGTYTFTISGLSAGSHSFSAAYAGDTTNNPSATTSNLAFSVSQAPLTVAGTCTNRNFYTANSCSAAVTGAYGNGDTAATVFASGPTPTTAATLNSPAGSYATSATYTLTAAGATNYTITNTPGSFTITAAGTAQQRILFAPLPSFVSGGSYQLAATSTSGLPVSYTVVSGSASIATGSSILQVTGPGAVMVKATCTDASNDYAAATPVTRSFTAQ